MAKIAEIVAQDPWWKHGAEFARFDKNLREAGPIFGRNYQGQVCLLDQTDRLLLKKTVQVMHMCYYVPINI